MSSFFFQLTISLWVVHFSYNFCSSFIFVHLSSSTQPESVGSNPALNHKFFNEFFGIVRPKKYFSKKNQNFGDDLGRSRLVFLFQLTISLWLVHFSYKSYNLTISQFLTILSLGSSIFISFKKLNGAKEYFRLCETFFRKKFSPKGPTFNFLIFLDRMDFEKSQMVPPFSFFGIERLFSKKNSIKGSPIHQYFDILKSFWYFWALDMALTWADLGCFLFFS